MATPQGFVLCGDLNATAEDLELETLCALLGVDPKGGVKLKSEKRRLDYILCGATLHEINLKISKTELVFKENIQGEKLPYSDHQGVSATIRAAIVTSHRVLTNRTLARAFRYMKHSIGMTHQVGRWLRWIPVIGFLFRQLMKPQMIYIQALLAMLETDLKEVESGHPLRLKNIG